MAQRMAHEIAQRMAHRMAQKWHGRRDRRRNKE